MGTNTGLRRDVVCDKKSRPNFKCESSSRNVRISDYKMWNCHLSLLEEEMCWRVGTCTSTWSLPLPGPQHFTSVKLIITPSSRCTTWRDIHVHVNTKCVVQIRNSFKPTTPADSRKKTLNSFWRRPIGYTENTLDLWKIQRQTVNIIYFFTALFKSVLLVFSTFSWKNALAKIIFASCLYVQTRLWTERQIRMAKNQNG